MKDYSIQLGALRFWNRVAILALVLFLPIAYLAGLATEGTFLAEILPISVGLFCFGAFVFSYVQIRRFRCPACGNYFTVKHSFATNSNGRACVHCGLSAYASKVSK